MIETLLTEIAEAGWTLGYLRQAGVGWEVQLKRPSDKGGFDISFHYANSPGEAIEGALTQGEMVHEALHQVVYSTRGVDILADLGLSKPINRRF